MKIGSPYGVVDLAGAFGDPEWSSRSWLKSGSPPQCGGFSWWFWCTRVVQQELVENWFPLAVVDLAGGFGAPELSSRGWL